MLIQDGLAPLTQVTEGGQTPIHWGVLGGNLLVVELLLAGGADPCALDNNDLTTLHMAASKGYASILDKLLTTGAKPVIDNQAKQLEETPLMMACASGHLECVKVLMAHGADIGVWSVTAENVVDIATRFGHVHIADYLRKDMAQADAKNYLEMLRRAEERLHRLEARKAEKYAAERAERLEREMAWLARDAQERAEKAAELERRRKEFARIARELRERYAREYAAKSRMWSEQNQNRREQASAALVVFGFGIALALISLNWPACGLTHWLTNLVFCLFFSFTFFRLRAFIFDAV